MEDFFREMATVGVGVLVSGGLLWLLLQSRVTAKIQELISPVEKRVKALEDASPQVALLEIKIDTLTVSVDKVVKAAEQLTDSNREARDQMIAAIGKADLDRAEVVHVVQRVDKIERDEEKRETNHTTLTKLLEGVLRREQPAQPGYRGSNRLPLEDEG